jgi:hypothetical protein
MDSEEAQRSVMRRAVMIHVERNKLYHDNWRRFGWRGCLFRLRERTERAWDGLWDAPAQEPPLEIVDDLLDLINFAAYTIRAIEEGNRDGIWFGEDYWGAIERLRKEVQ